MTNSTHGNHWSLDDILLNCVDVERVRSQDDLFLLLAGASFVETGSDLYTRNLVQQFQDDPEVSLWLTNHWEPEELQHGRALRAYVDQVWPDFDWQSAFTAFIADYSRGCTVGELESTRALEMAARCVVEMGTATSYLAIQTNCDEPVLRQLVGLIQRDEVNHYKHFYRYFSKYNELEQNNRATVLGALVRRLMEMLRSDTECGLWHAFHAVHPSASRNGREFRQALSRSTAFVSKYYPAPMAMKMLLKPLALPPAINRLSCAPAKLAQYLILR